MSGGCPVARVRAGSGGSLAGVPEHIVVSIVVGGAGQDEQQVGEPVEVDEHLLVDGLRFGQSQHLDLAAAANGSRLVQCSGGRRTAGQHEALQRFEPFGEGVDGGFECRDLFGNDPQRG